MKDLHRISVSLADGLIFVLHRHALIHRYDPAMNDDIRSNPLGSDLTRANRLVTCFEPLEDVAGCVGEVGVEGEALAVDLDGR